MQTVTSGCGPTPRRAAASTAIGHRWIIVHGGFDGTQCLGDTFVLDTEELSWRTLALDQVHQPTCQLTPRALHTIVVVEHGLLVLGGASQNKILQSSYYLFDSSVQNGVTAARMLVAAEYEAAALKESVGTMEIEISRLKLALQDVKQQKEVCSGTAHTLTYDLSNGLVITLRNNAAGASHK